MANPTNVFDFLNETLIQFLAQVVSDGTYDDVNTTEKVDQPGQEADATEISVAAGQLWSNMMDDFLQAAYPLLRQVATGGVGASADIINSGLSTGMVDGGLLSVGAPPDKFSISDGFGFVVDNTTDPLIPTLTKVTWAGLTDIIVSNIGGQLITFVSIDMGGTVIQQGTRWTRQESRDRVLLGVVVHVDLVNVDTVNNEQNAVINLAAQVGDIFSGLGFVNVNGNVFSPNGVNLNLDKSVGVLMSYGVNWDVDPKNPNHRTLASLIALTFQYRFQGGANGATGALVDPDIYDLAGVSTPVPVNKFTVQRIFCFTSNNVKIQPGQTLYNSLDDAKADIPLDAFVTEPSIAANGLLRAFLILREGTTDLTDPTDSLIISAGKLGEATGGGGGGSGASGPAGGDLNGTYPNPGFINGAPVKAVPVGDDFLGIADSAAGGAIKQAKASGVISAVAVVPTTALTVLVDEVTAFATTDGKAVKGSNFRTINGGLCYALLNGSGVALAIGTVMEVDPVTPGSCQLAGANTSTYCGIVVEAAGAGPGDLVWLSNVGECLIECEAGPLGVIAIGDHLDSAGAGLAHTHGFATGNTFAVAITAKGLGLGSVQAIQVAKGGNGDVSAQLPAISIPNQIASYPGTDAHLLGLSPGLFSFGACLTIDLENKSGGAIPLGTVLKADDLNDNAVVVGNSAQIDAFAGIAMAVSAADGDPTYCGIMGVATVNCTAAAVVRGDYMEVDTVTPGLAIGLASGGSGSFGIALTGKGAGLGQVQVLLRGMEIF